MITFPGITFENASAFPQGRIPVCELAIPCSYSLETIIPEFRKAGVTSILFRFGKETIPETVENCRKLFAGFRQAFYFQEPVDAQGFAGCEPVFAEWNANTAGNFPERCRELVEKGHSVTAVFPYQEGDLAAVESCIIQLKKYGIPVESGCSTAFVHAFEGPSEQWLRLFPQEKAGTPFPGKVCIRNGSSCFITETGEVQLCKGLTLSAGNLTEKPFSQIVFESHFLRTFRSFRGEVKEPCSGCRKAVECFGCRGRAWSFSGDVVAPDPACGGRDNIVKLPCRTPDDFLPHRRPVLMADTLLRYGDNSCEVEACIRGDNPFLTDNGTLDPAALIELGAQALAFLDTFLHPGKTWKGMLLEAMRFNYTGNGIRAGDTLYVYSGKQCEMDPWHVGFFHIYDKNRQQIAEGELKVCQTSGDMDLPFPH